MKSRYQLIPSDSGDDSTKYKFKNFWGPFRLYHLSYVADGQTPSFSLATPTAINVPSNASPLTPRWTRTSERALCMNALHLVCLPQARGGISRRFSTFSKWRFLSSLPVIVAWKDLWPISVRIVADFDHWLSAPRISPDSLFYSFQTW